MESTRLAGYGVDLDYSEELSKAAFEERHFTVSQIGEMWNLSGDAVRKLFEEEPGVMVIGENARKGKRRYTTLRVPESVAQRVHRRLCNPDLTGGRRRA
jgi:hypothetical protein